MNNDGIVSPADTALIMNNLIANGPHVLSASEIGGMYRYYDVNGDGQVSELDLVPEPATWWLAAPGLLAILWYRRRVASK